MKAKIEITMNNAAFADEPASEFARILRQLATDVEQGEIYRTLRDINGNPVGCFEIESDFRPTI